MGTNKMKGNSTIITILGTIGLVSIMGLLFNVNRISCQENREDIKENMEYIFALDKKLDILIAIQRIKDSLAVKIAEEEVNNSIAEADSTE